MRNSCIVLLCFFVVCLGACGPTTTPTETNQEQVTQGPETTKDTSEQAVSPEKPESESVADAAPESVPEATSEPVLETKAEPVPEVVKEEVPGEVAKEDDCASKPEVCNGKDNNCDGQIDCSDHKADQAALGKGIAKIAAPGLPGALVVFGHLAFPVAAGTSGSVKDSVAAAAKWGKGRVIIFSHGGYVGANDLKYETTGQLLQNSVNWLAYGTKPSTKKQKIAVVGNISLAYLQQEKYAITKLGSDWPTALKSYQVLMIRSGDIKTQPQQQIVIQYVQDGGGLLMAETGWGWAQLNPKKDIVDDFAGNVILRQVGLAWTADTITDGKPGYDNSKPPSTLLHAQVALELLVKHTEGSANPSAADLSQATHTVTRAMPYLHSSDKLLLPKVEQLLQKYGSQIVPTAKTPIKTSDGLKRVLLAYQITKNKQLPPDQIKAHPAADTFPGKIPAGSKRVTESITIDTKSHDWHSTGLYAAPGEVVTVSVPTKATNKGLSVRIGAHKDKLWSKDAWRRVPDITRTWTITQDTTKAANAFGGLIYVVVPKNSTLGVVKVTIGNAVQAPLFVLGTTKVSDWNSTIRQYPAPWAELANDKIILTVPSSAIKALSDPDKLMQYWDKVMDAAADLATIPHQRARPERVVMDEQISAGYMHAGYPIMTHLDVRTSLPNTAHMAKNGGWGIFHEIGHNHQSRYWTFGGTGEVTVNLFTLYIFEFVHNNKMPRANIYGTQRETQIKSYIKNGTKFSEWQSKPFLALLMYMQLQEEFGWKTYKKVFSEYRNAPASQLPKNDAEERDQWMVRFSKAVGKNLGPFFQAWGVPTTAAARQSIANLPTWMPKGFPPKP